ncbi:hypothetical protein PU630_02620 [Microbacterium horticulturae]|uniref:Uncharacterized protein n=1 Tax=Microbacterium horticulturae TaxID=3028316 RepID=A0ABY8BZ51_9MICO|nr:hypothetical protein [Microbacterium sp. KACC 23027]WEG09479.1 hypothetical protein PU630_02620 [Microbacterium sp. KACC 23027]
MQQGPFAGDAAGELEEVRVAELVGQLVDDAAQQTGRLDDLLR